MLKQRRQRGDTMIEVLLSVAIFSVVAVMGLTVMNQGSASSQRALEITLVRNEIEAQATALRFVYDAALAQKSSASYDSTSVDPNSPAGQWDQILTLRKSSATPFNAMVTGIDCIAPSSIVNAFVLNPRTTELYTQAANSTTWGVASVFSRIRFDTPTSGAPHPTAIRSSPANQGVEGIWVEAVRGAATAVGGVEVPGYTDFHIRACWDTVGQAQPATLGTIVRLYEP